MGPKREAEDRQRIYTAVIQQLASDVILQRWNRAEDAVVGDVITSSTRWPIWGRWDPWMVGILVELPAHRGDRYVVRDVASSRTCRVDNDSFHVVRGLRPEALFAGYQFEAYRRCLSAFRAGHRAGVLDDYGSRFGGLTFADRDTRDGVLEVRPHSLYRPKLPDHLPDSDWYVIARTKKVPIRASSRLRVRDLVAELEAIDGDPYDYFALPNDWKPDPSMIGRPTSVTSPEDCPRAVLVEQKTVGITR